MVVSVLASVTSCRRPVALAGDSEPVLFVLGLIGLFYAIKKIGINHP
jgi:hypothetical protein